VPYGYVDIQANGIKKLVFNGIIYTWWKSGF
jgi:hypothetical protein